MPSKRRKRELVKLLVSMIMASNLQGCGAEEADGIVCQQLDSICSVCGSLHGHCDASNHLQVGREGGGDRELGTQFSRIARLPVLFHMEMPYCEELDGDPFAEIHAEEEPRPETVADGEAEIQ